jgi:TRAP-type uncharacterized transport system substrate-binding protein
MCVSYILSSFYYACLEEQAIPFVKNDRVLADGTTELNMCMRLTDDYLLMTTSKSNAMLFIERLHGMSLANNFKFNMKKLRTNFVVNLTKINYTHEKDRADAKAAVLAKKGEID